MPHPDTVSTASRALAVADTPAFPAVTAGTVGSVAIQTVDGRALHAFLEVGRDFTNWIKGRIQTYGFEKGVDYEVYAAFGENSSGGLSSPKRASAKSRPQRRTEYVLTIDMAKTPICSRSRWRTATPFSASARSTGATSGSPSATP